MPGLNKILRPLSVCRYICYVSLRGLLLSPGEEKRSRRGDYHSENYCPCAAGEAGYSGQIGNCSAGGKAKQNDSAYDPVLPGGRYNHSEKHAVKRHAESTYNTQG